MKQLLVWVWAIAITTTFAYAQTPLSITVLKADRSGKVTYLLFSVENKSDQAFEWARLSCVFFDRGEPVFEEQSTVENVQPRSRAVQRIIQGYGGPFDNIECRLMGSRPNAPESAEQLVPQPSARPRGTAQDDMSRFVSKVLGSTEVQWKQMFAKDGKTYRAPVLVLYKGQTQAGCGRVAQSATGPFYCPADQKIYLDTSFFDQIATRFRGCDDGNKACQFSEAYVIANLVGRHVQNLLGILPKAQQAQRAADNRAAADHIQMQLDLQADCLAGIWANRENESLKSDGKPAFIESRDIEAALLAASGGDMTAQRQRWFNNGFISGSLQSCNTFAATQL